MFGSCVSLRRFLYNISDHSNDVIAQRKGISTNMSIKTNGLSSRPAGVNVPNTRPVSSTKLSNFFHFNLSLLVQSHSSHGGRLASADSFSSAQQNLVNWTLAADEVGDEWLKSQMETENGMNTPALLSVWRENFTYKVICQCFFSKGDVSTFYLLYLPFIPLFWYPSTVVLLSLLIKLWSKHVLPLFTNKQISFFETGKK